MQTVVNLASLVLFAALLAAGQLLFKQSAGALVGKPALAGFAALMHTPVFYAAVLLYGATTFLYVWILSRVPLSLAYPFMALNVLAIPLLSSWIFGEVVTPSYWLGAVLIMIGLAIIQLSA